jgi:hypothetical protein
MYVKSCSQKLHIRCNALHVGEMCLQWARGTEGSEVAVRKWIYSQRCLFLYSAEDKFKEFDPIVLCQR